MSGKTFLIMAGGTGGHVFPAIAVAAELLQQGYNVHWLGTKKGIEARVVPENNLPIHFIDSAGVRGKGLWNKVKALMLMLRGLWQSLCLIRKLKPVAVLGMGGFVTVPGGLAAYFLRVPLIIQEQNAIAGSANRLLSRVAKLCLEGFPEAFSFASGKNNYTGNPVRKEITRLKTDAVSLSKLNNKKAPLNLLVLGGSLGAKPINDILPEAIGEYLSEGQLQVWQQTGQLTYDETLAHYQNKQIDVDGASLRVTPFIDDMSAAYCWADFVLCRAGAISLAEIACAGLPAILVPLPHAIDNHQYKNSLYFVEQEAALLMPQKEMTIETLQAKLKRFIDEPNFLQHCAQRCKALAQPLAAQKVASLCLEVAHA